MGDQADTVFVNKESFTDIHPLENEWTLLYDNPAASHSTARKKDWTRTLKEVHTISSVEAFWQVFNNVPRPSSLEGGCSFYFFKKGIKPAWEDTANEKGGKWLYNFPKSTRAEQMDEMWINLLMIMAGEQFDEHGNQICGAVISRRRKGDKVAVWTRDAKNEKATTHVGKVIKEKLGITTQLGFQDHQLSLSAGRSYSGSDMYTV